MASVQLLDKKKKSMRRRERGEVLVAPEIPSDLLIEILKKLPAKSLARFKCVSKLWSSLIHSKGYFFASPPRLYISLVEKYHNCGEDCHYLRKSVLLSLSTSSKSSTAFDLDTTKPGIRAHNMMVVRGLILYTVCRRACIYNPTTGESVILPPIFAIDHDYFIGYDPILDQYKVVCTVVVESVTEIDRFDPQHWVFVLKAGSSWKRIELDRPHYPCFYKHRLCSNGVIHYLAFDFVFGIHLISFNVRSEEFNMIQIPHVVYDHVSYLGIIDYSGKPTLFDCVHMKNSLVNLWVLEDDGTWLKMSLVLQSCQKHLIPTSLKVIGTTQSGEVVLHKNDYILYYDLHKNDLKKMDVRGISDHELNSEWDFDLSQVDEWKFYLDTGESIMPLEI